MFRGFWRRLLPIGRPQSSDSPTPVKLPCERCKEPQTFHIIDISRAGDLTELHLCEACAQSVLTRPYQSAPSVLSTDATEEVA